VPFSLSILVLLERFSSPHQYLAFDHSVWECGCWPPWCSHLLSNILSSRHITICIPLIYNVHFCPFLSHSCSLSFPKKQPNQ
jgi:hypothetical protein